MESKGLESTMAHIDAVKDVMSVRRVYGDAYQADGVTIIPVASIRGGGGGGGGEGTGDQNGKSGSGIGAGLGFGVSARPVGAYVVKGGEVSWQPAVDVMRVIIGGQLLGLVAILTLRSVLRRRHRR
jgi:uncharacterized spore protein YtfJ